MRRNAAGAACVTQRTVLPTAMLQAMAAAVHCSRSLLLMARQRAALPADAAESKQSCWLRCGSKRCRLWRSIGGSADDTCQPLCAAFLLLR